VKIGLERFSYRFNEQVLNSKLATRKIKKQKMPASELVANIAIGRKRARQKKLFRQFGLYREHH
jgi:hypothetical protein